MAQGWTNLGQDPPLQPSGQEPAQEGALHHQGEAPAACPAATGAHLCYCHVLSGGTALRPACGPTLWAADCMELVWPRCSPCPTVTAEILAGPVLPCHVTCDTPSPRLTWRELLATHMHMDFPASCCSPHSPEQIFPLKEKYCITFFWFRPRQPPS